MPATNTTRRHARHGFTLIEVMIAIAIVVILIGIVGFNVIGQQDTAKVGQAKIQMRQIEGALDDFRLAFGRYPTETEGIAVLWNSENLEVDDEEEESAWRRFLTDPVPEDVWGNEWNYTDDVDEDLPREYELWSNGPDGEEGNDDDITSWTEEDDGGMGGMGPAPAPGP